MKYLFSILTVVALSLLVIACSGDKSAEIQETDPVVQKIEVSSVNELSSNVDPVCGMTLDDNMIYSAAQYDGKKIGFCNAGCATRFAENPKEYVAKISEDHQNHQEGEHQM